MTRGRAVSAVAWVILCVHAQHLIKLSAIQIDTNTQPSMNVTELSHGTHLVLVHASTSISSVLADFLSLHQEHGIELVHYLPDNAYCILTPREALIELAKTPEIDWIGPVLPQYKFPKFFETEQSKKEVIVLLSSKDDSYRVAQQLTESLEQYGFSQFSLSVESDKKVVLRADSAVATIEMSIRLAESPFVLWIEFVGEYSTMMREIKPWLLQGLGTIEEIDSFWSQSSPQLRLYSKGLTGLIEARSLCP